MKQRFSPQILPLRYGTQGNHEDRMSGLYSLNHLERRVSMNTLLTRVMAALILLAVAGCAGTMGKHETAMEWMARQPSTDDK
jgi:hypothetical protein